MTGCGNLTQELLNMFWSAGNTSAPQREWRPLKYGFNFEQATYAVDGGR
jgi:hypothetical protein